METLVTTLSRQIDGNEMNLEKHQEETKRCPYCAELILAAAIKCKHCGEFLTAGHTPPPIPNANSGKKWHQSNTTIVLALLTMGPLALPMVWLNKRYSPVVKTIITVVVVGLTLGLCYSAFRVYRGIFDQIKAMGINGIY